MAVVLFAAGLGWFGVKRMGASSAPPLSGRVAVAPGPGETKPAPDTPARTEPGAAGTSPGTADQAATSDSVTAPPVPSFDVVRVEPSGESVIAGRAAPGAVVELMGNGTSLARVVADASGLFAVVPPALAPGSHDIVLNAIAPDGGRTVSAQSVTVVIAERRNAPPLVAMATPGQPVVVLSRPDDPGQGARDAASRPQTASSAAGQGVASPPPGSAAGSTKNAGSPSNADRTAAAATQVSGKRAEVRIAAVEAEGTGRLFVSGSAAPGATIRLYLNGSYVAPGSTGSDGRLSFTIERGIRPGSYQVRLDDVDPVGGSVRSRAEVPFTVPAAPLLAATEAANPNLARSPTASAGTPAGRPAPNRPPDPRGPLSTSPVPSLAPPGGIVAGGVVVPAAPVRVAEAGQPGTRPLVPPAAVAPSTSVNVTGAPRPAPEAGAVVVAEVNTAIVLRGENLWSISKRTYGRGMRYTVIYGANLPQIRNPSLIYPGQVFVLPTGDITLVR